VFTIFKDDSLSDQGENDRYNDISPDDNRNITKKDKEEKKQRKTKLLDE
jgi:hypothetical protein